ncbi:MAG: hypothetical protein QXV22_03995 [Thermoplasmataceae archaeon]
MEDLVQVSDRLDFTLQVSFHIQQEFLPVFSKVEQPIPLHVSVLSDRAEIFMYVNSRIMGKYEPLISKVNHDSMGDYKVLHLPANDLLPELRVFMNLIKIPSVVPGGLFLHNGSVHADFRFHRASSSAVNRVLREVFSAENRIKVNYLGPSFGIVSTLRDIDTRIPITVVMVSYGVGGENNKDRDSVAEAKIFSWEDLPECRMVTFGSHLHNDCTVVDPINQVFECDPRSDFLREILRVIRREHLPIASLLETNSSGRVTYQIFVPTFISEKLALIFLDYADKLSLPDFSLERFMPFNRWVDSIQKS